MTELIALGKRVLASQPFSELLGAELTGLSDRDAELRLAIRPEMKQQHGFVHGGVLSYLADNALTFAGGMALGGNAVTSEFKINYIRPAIGDMLIARAQVVGLTRSQAVVRCDVLIVVDGVEKPCAAAQGTIATLPKRADDDTGPRVG